MFAPESAEARAMGTQGETHSPYVQDGLTATGYMSVYINVTAWARQQAGLCPCEDTLPHSSRDLCICKWQRSVEPL